MHCGHLQFQQGSWHHRNYILLNGKRHRLTIPIQKEPHFRPIRDAWFSDQKWKERHLKTIAQAYGDAPFFDDYFPTLKEIIYHHPHSLEQLNMHLTGFLAGWLDINTEIVDSANWHFNGDAIDMIIQMCQAVDADHYLSNEGATGYISFDSVKRLKDAGIWHTWLNFTDPDEEPLSAIHHLFTLGPKAARLIR